MLRKLIASAAVVGTLSACDVEGALNDIKQDIIDAAFEEIVKDAREHGGEAVMLHPGKLYTLTVNNPASPINGATIIVPADALPAEAENVALSIQTPPEGTNPPISPDDLKLNGPTALVSLVELPDLMQVKLAKAINIALPYAAGDTYPADKLVLGNVPQNASDMQPAKVEGSKSDAAKKQVSGDVLEPNLLMAIYPVEYAGGAAAANSASYKVTEADGTTVLCVGQIDDAATKFTAKARTSSTAGDVVTLSLAGVGSLISITDNDGVDDMNAPPTTGSLQINPDVTTVSLTCKSGTYTNDVNMTPSHLTFTNFVTPGTDPHLGSVDVTSEIHFTNTAGQHVWIAITATVPEFSWAE